MPRYWGCTWVLWIVARFHLGIGLVAVGLTAIALGVAADNERLQRAITLEDTEFVSERIRASANESFFELMIQYPAGAGMGSAFGTSIPYFLADRTPTAIGLENEYSRILVDQGLVGLGLWLAFLVWLLHRPPPPFRLDVPWGLGVIFMYALVSTNWLTAFYRPRDTFGSTDLVFSSRADGGISPSPRSRGWWASEWVGNCRG